MNMNSYKVWALFGAGAGAGFGVFAAPLIYILINMFYDGVTLSETISFAIGNGFTWAIFGLFFGLFLYGINASRKPLATE